jgi:uncharacterized protein with ParB-like and HNH nuclease domain
MKWRDVEPYIKGGEHEFNVALSFLLTYIDQLKKEGLQLNPDFQRGHIWTEEQQILFCEYFFKCGKSGRIIYFNNPDWDQNCSTSYRDFVCVDGLQRLTALMKFLNNNLPVFGKKLNEFEGRLRTSRAHDYLKININTLQTKKEVLEWYVQMNSGGTVHTTKEIDKVKNMINLEVK